MDFLFNGVSIITIFGTLYKALNLFLAKKTDVIFFTEGKRIVRNIVYIIILILLMTISIYITPLQLNKMDIINDTLMNISNSLLFLAFVTNIVMYFLVQIKFLKKKKLFKHFYGNWIYGLLIYIIFWVCGSIYLLSLAQIENNVYLNNNEITTGVLAWAILTVFMFQLYISEYRKIVRYTCWIDYSNNADANSEKYYILYSSDKEYVVCGRNDSFEENSDFKFIKIKEIKEKYIIHFEENNKKSWLETVYDKIRTNSIRNKKISR